MIPAFFILASMKYLSLPLWAAALLALAISLPVLGVAFKRSVVNQLLRSGFVPQLGPIVSASMRSSMAKVTST
jgi:branched-chain amino acid transport system permease protein